MYHKSHSEVKPQYIAIFHTDVHVSIIILQSNCCHNHSNAHNLCKINAFKLLNAVQDILLTSN